MTSYKTNLACYWVHWKCDRSQRKKPPPTFHFARGFLLCSTSTNVENIVLHNDNKMIVQSYRFRARFFFSQFHFNRICMIIWMDAFRMSVYVSNNFRHFVLFIFFVMSDGFHSFSRGCIIWIYANWMMNHFGMDKTSASLSNPFSGEPLEKRQK